MPFNRIFLLDGERRKELATDEFMAIELKARIKIILEGRVIFMNDDTEIQALSALRAIYAMR